MLPRLRVLAGNILTCESTAPKRETREARGTDPPSRGCIHTILYESHYFFFFMLCPTREARGMGRISRPSLVCPMLSPRCSTQRLWRRCGPPRHAHTRARARTHASTHARKRTRTVVSGGCPCEYAYNHSCIKHTYMHAYIQIKYKIMQYRCCSRRWPSRRCPS